MFVRSCLSNWRLTVKHPSLFSYRQYLDQEVALSEEMVHKYSDLALAKFNKSIGELRRLFLVEDLVDSIKVGGASSVRGLLQFPVWRELIGWLSLPRPNPATVCCADVDPDLRRCLVQRSHSAHLG